MTKNSKSNKKNSVKKSVVKVVKTKSVGRPRLKLKYPSGHFTVDMLVEKNIGSKEMTARAHIKRGLIDGTIVRVEKKQPKDAKAGRPQAWFKRVNPPTPQPVVNENTTSVPVVNVTSETPAVETTVVETVPTEEVPATVVDVVTETPAVS